MVVDLHWLSMVMSVFVSSTLSEGNYVHENAGKAGKAEMKNKSNVSVCESAVCNCTFSLISSKNHCNECGGVFCSDCSKRKLRLPHRGYENRVRVCNRCWRSLLQRGINCVDEKIPHIIRYDEVASGLFFFYICVFIFITF